MLSCLLNAMRVSLLAVLALVKAVSRWEMVTKSHIAPIFAPPLTATVSQNNILQTPYNTIQAVIDAVNAGNTIRIQGEPTMLLC